MQAFTNSRRARARHGIARSCSGESRRHRPYNKRYYDNRRYYDRDGRDYHVWNEGEDRAYRFYLTDQHLEYREWRTVERPRSDSILPVAAHASGFRDRRCKK